NGISFATAPPNAIEQQDAINGEGTIRVFPNPFSSSITIHLSGVQEHQNTSAQEIKIYDISGRVVKTLNILPVDGRQQTAVTWNGRDDGGKELPSGVYYLKFAAGEYKTTRKLLLVK
ncbi:MAG: T9SS type A sorting domain-containing protein, partial [Candidatus Cloacimonadota bacterium]